MEIVVPPRVQALAEDSPLKDDALPEAQALDRSLGKLLFRVVGSRRMLLILTDMVEWGGTSGLGNGPKQTG